MLCRTSSLEFVLLLALALGVCACIGRAFLAVSPDLLQVQVLRPGFVNMPGALFSAYFAGLCLMLWGALQSV